MLDKSTEKWLMRSCKRAMMALVFMLTLTAVSNAQAQSYNEKAVAEFYKGKTVTLTVGFAPGGGYDIATRVVARHLARHIPGRPSVIVANRPGGGSLIAANLVYGRLAQDGTQIVNFHPQMILQQAQGREGIVFV